MIVIGAIGGRNTGAIGDDNSTVFLSLQALPNVTTSIVTRLKISSR